MPFQLDYTFILIKNIYIVIAKIRNQIGSLYQNQIGSLYQN